MIELEQRAEKVGEILTKYYPSPKTELVYKNEYELAVSVMLSAQTTDKKVNQVTPELFKKYPDWLAASKADPKDVAKIIHAVNFHIGKSERFVKAGEFVTNSYNGKLPKSMEKLILIPGIARKSANVILNELWGITEGIVVDTHVSRVTNLLGLTKNSDPKKIEQDLMKLLPKKYWGNFSGSCVLLGRYICIANRPKCGECPLSGVCPSAFKS